MLRMRTDIFISYRIADTLTQAGRLHQSLETHFGADTVFYDKRNLEPGDKWPDELKKRLLQARVVLLLYRSPADWLGVDQEFGGRRIDNPEDWVRREIETALGEGPKGEDETAPVKKDIMLIPVLFGTKPLPEAGKLPDSLKKLPELQALTIREDHWDNDLRPLLEKLEPVVSPRRARAQAPRPHDPLEQLPLPDDLKPPVFPYKGLHWFEASDARVFFGREEEIALLYKTRIQSEYDVRLILFYGQSGAGKSSLLHAGLLPRLRRQGWIPEYRRRTLDGTAVDIVRGYLGQLGQIPEDSKPILIIDQLEEMFTNARGDVSSPELAELPGLLHELLGRHPNLRILLGFREDFLAQVENLLGDITCSKFQLKVMERAGLRRAVAAIPESELRHRYNDISFAPGEENLPDRIADDLYAPDDNRSNAAPLLQFVLRKMWDELAPGNPPVVFSWQLYERHRRRSAVELLRTQLETLRNSHSDALASGLVLDLLRDMVTPDNTAGKQEATLLEKRYRHLPEGHIASLCRALKNCYLLDETKSGYRLTHDALAPAVLKLFGESTAPGQRARQILESKLKDTAESWTDHDILFSMVDLDIISHGKDGMYCPPDDWTAKVDTATQHYRKEREKDEQQRREIASFLLGQAEAHKYQLKYEDAYHKAVDAMHYGCLHKELTDLFVEIAFVEAEGSRRELVFYCLQRIGELTGDIPDTEELPAAGGVVFARAVQLLLEKLDADRVRTLCRRYFPDMVEVPGGRFIMGEGEEGGIAHPVSVSSFAMARTPVTWEQFALFCMSTGRALPDFPSWGPAADNPVVNVSWYDAVEYANWVSERLGRQAAYHIGRETKDKNNISKYDEVKWTVTFLPGSDGFRLPTEAEWEYAARGGAGGIRDRFVYSGSNVIDEVAWYEGNSAVPDGIRRTRSVYDTKQPNQLGIAHLSGNVREWCWDWYSAYTADEQENPQGALEGGGRVNRGGSWFNEPQNCRAAFRFHGGPSNGAGNLGFRLAVSLQ